VGGGGPRRLGLASLTRRAARAIPCGLPARRATAAAPAAEAPADPGPADSGPADSGPADSGPADSGPAHRGRRGGVGKRLRRSRRAPGPRRTPGGCPPSASRVHAAPAVGPSRTRPGSLSTRPRRLGMARGCFRRPAAPRGTPPRPRSRTRLALPPRGLLRRRIPATRRRLATCGAPGASRRAPGASRATSPGPALRRARAAPRQRAAGRRPARSRPAAGRAAAGRGAAGRADPATFPRHGHHRPDSLRFTRSGSVILQRTRTRGLRARGSARASARASICRARTRTRTRHARAGLRHG
jgi:hypothetical protein